MRNLTNQRLGNLHSCVRNVKDEKTNKKRWQHRMLRCILQNVFLWWKLENQGTSIDGRWLVAHFQGVSGRKVPWTEPPTQVQTTESESNKRPRLEPPTGDSFSIQSVFTAFSSHYRLRLIFYWSQWNYCINELIPWIESMKRRHCVVVDTKSFRRKYETFCSLLETPLFAASDRFSTLCVFPSKLMLKYVRSSSSQEILWLPVYFERLFF